MLSVAFYLCDAEFGYAECCHAECRCAECCMLSVTVLSVAVLSVAVLSVAVLNVVMLSVAMLSVAMLSVTLLSVVSPPDATKLKVFLVFQQLFTSLIRSVPLLMHIALTLHEITRLLILPPITSIGSFLGHTHWLRYVSSRAKIGSLLATMGLSTLALKLFI
jgi:hypothetical protein